MDSALTDLLQCPVCAGPMAPDGDPAGLTGLVCRRRHRFDRARHGYVNLLTGKASAFVPDTAAMVQARETFLAAGHFDPLAEAIRRHTQLAVGEGIEPAILDAGAGTGFYLSAVLQPFSGVRALAMDISKFALRRAGRLLPQALSLAWDIWRPLPVATGVLDVVLNVFAPRNPAEFARVLAAGGRLIVVTPRPGHLAELRRAVSLLDVQTDKAEHLARTLEPHFVQLWDEDLGYTMALTPADIRLAALMGPAAHHIDEDELLTRLRALPDAMDVTAAFRISIYAKR